MRPGAPGAPLITPGVREFSFSARGNAGIRHIREIIGAAPEAADADVVISLISQSDVALAKSGIREGRIWIAWVRGRPWPAVGEQSLLRRAILRVVETAALRQADDVWATTPVLAGEFASAREAHIVPAGIAPVRRIANGQDGSGPLVWAGRVAIDKRPGLFADIVAKTGHAGVAFGDGPLLGTLKSRSVPGLRWEGWTDSDSLWADASVFVGTSTREAFGRSAVEAAAAGLPVVLGAQYGAAPLLFTDQGIRRACVVDSDDPAVWARAVRTLLDDADLREAVSEHVHSNAQQLTIDASVRRAISRAQELRQERIER
ncbi:glycosyltransferase family 4 protein [Microbacterium caowuchunii]|uniref:glycosyltransferase family 4 protein n=1 Tax=Microbacterium caowuchunii TaxID=2614638 RepID=UPI003B849668